MEFGNYDSRSELEQKAEDSPAERAKQTLHRFRRRGGNLYN
jgi:hypothetical protein